MDKLLKIKDVAERLGLSPNSVYLMAQEERIPAFKVAGGWRVRESKLEEWVKRVELLIKSWILRLRLACELLSGCGMLFMDTSSKVWVPFFL